jgi:hypothetical protein
MPPLSARTLPLKQGPKDTPLLTAPLRFFPGRRKSPPIEHGAFSAPSKNAGDWAAASTVPNAFCLAQGSLRPSARNREAAHAWLLWHPCLERCAGHHHSLSDSDVASYSSKAPIVASGEHRCSRFKNVVLYAPGSTISGKSISRHPLKKAIRMPCRSSGRN